MFISLIKQISQKPKEKWGEKMKPGLWPKATEHQHHLEFCTQVISLSTGLKQSPCGGQEVWGHPETDLTLFSQTISNPLHKDFGNVDEMLHFCHSDLQVHEHHILSSSYSLEKWSHV